MFAKLIYITLFLFGVCMGENLSDNDTNSSEDSYQLDSITDPVALTIICGYSNLDQMSHRIKGADGEANFGEFPWMVGIKREDVDLEGSSLFHCGGSLITPQVALTAAHCIKDGQANDFKVRAGDWKINSCDTTAEFYQHQARRVVEIIVHEHYSRGSLINDVALLFLDSPLQAAPNVNTICLPPASLNFDKSRCFATGWGKDNFQNGQYQNILKKIELPVVPNDKCEENLRNTRLGKFFKLHSSFMCAGGERGKDTCKGDGGSPLVCPMSDNPNRYFQAGIVAWGIGCGDENIPGVYASVPRLRPWIDEQLAYRKINPEYFTP